MVLEVDYSISFSSIQFITPLALLRVTLSLCYMFQSLKKHFYRISSTGFSFLIIIVSLNNSSQFLRQHSLRRNSFPFWSGSILINFFKQVLSLFQDILCGCGCDYVVCVIKMFDAHKLYTDTHIGLLIQIFEAGGNRTCLTRHQSQQLVKRAIGRNC